jgi:hypothetical protein
MAEAKVRSVAQARFGKQLFIPGHPGLSAAGAVHFASCRCKAQDCTRQDAAASLEPGFLRLDVRGGSVVLVPLANVTQITLAE